MKRLYFLLLFIGCGHSSPTPPPPPTLEIVSLTWDTGNPSLPICSTNGCATTYTLTQDGVVIATLPATATSYIAYTTPVEHVYTLTANAIDPNGNVVSSTPSVFTTP